MKLLHYPAYVISMSQLLPQTSPVVRGPGRDVNSGGPFPPSHFDLVCRLHGVHYLVGHKLRDLGLGHNSVGTFLIVVLLLLSKNCSTDVLGYNDTKGEMAIIVTLTTQFPS